VAQPTKQPRLPMNVQVSPQDVIEQQAQTYAGIVASLVHENATKQAAIDLLVLRNQELQAQVSALVGGGQQAAKPVAASGAGK
jgi:hypothetical protein